MKPRTFYLTLFLGCLFSALSSGAVVQHFEEAKRLAQIREILDEPPPIFLVGCELRRSPHDGKTVELWHNGELSEEIEPRDGATYRVLDEALRRELSYR